MVPALLYPGGREVCLSSQKGRGKGESMGVLAVRVDALLNEARDWPLAGAVDYLIENGLAVVDGWHPLKRGRLASLRLRVSRLLKREGIVSVHQWYLFRGEGGAALVWWKINERGHSSWRLACSGSDFSVLWSLAWPGEERAWLTLPDVIRLWPDEFSEDWLCAVAILLWCADRCYRRR
jgi:hypothetical protein